MNKTELVAAVAAKSGISKKDADAAVSAVLDTIVESIAAGEKVSLVGFGTFERRFRAERMGCNPQKNEMIKIPAANVPAFKAGKAFKEAVNK